MKYITLLFLQILLSFSLKAQTDRYTIAIKTGWSKPSFVNFGKTKDWIDNGKGFELALIGIGYKNVYLNLTYKYFNGLKSEKEMIFQGYQFPTTAEYRNVFMNLTASYEYEFLKRLYFEPQVGWVRSYITSNVVDMQGDKIEIKKANGLIVGSNLTKYIKLYSKSYFGLFVNINYNLISYKNVSNDLGGNTLGFGFGLLIKGTN